jgi:divalent metal cation (Fe/Co/Zn/Cd) transporter
MEMASPAAAVTLPGSDDWLQAARLTRRLSWLSLVWLGIALTIATLAICQPLGLAKRRLGAKLGSPATVGEGTQNLLCGYMAVAVLVGLLANALFGIWWLDPVVALGIAGVAVQEGRKALRGEGCGCVAC